MDDPTRLSCCERDARDSERNMKILTELRKRDPTRIALQKRNLRQHHQSSWCEQHHISQSRNFLNTSNLRVGEGHECRDVDCSHHSQNHKCGSHCHHYDGYQGHQNKDHDEEEKHWDDESEDSFSDDSDDEFQMELVRKRMQSLQASKRRRVVVTKIEEKDLEKRIQDIKKVSRHVVVLYERSSETIRFTELLLSSLEKVCENISLEILHVVPREYGVAEATNSFGQVRSKLNIRTLPALTCVTCNGVITGTMCGENLHRQFGDLSVSTELLSQWLKRSRVLCQPDITKSTSTLKGEEGEEEEEDDCSHDCGRKNCPIKYYHEHVDSTLFQSDIKSENFMEGV